MLFLVGLELEPRRLWAMRRPIFGGSSVQLLGSAVLMLGVAVAAGVGWQVALVERPVYLILLAQGGEFGFVVFQAAQQAGVMAAPTASFLVAAVALSMVLTPRLLLGADRWWVPRLGLRAGRSGAAKPAEISAPQIPRSSLPALAVTARSWAACSMPTA